MAVGHREMRMPGRRGWSEVRRPLGALGIVCLLMAGCTAEGGEPDALVSPSPRGIFADVVGRIVYGHLRLRSGGIFAVDPMRPNDPEDRILVSRRGGEPLGWSSDGSSLLIRRQVPDANGGIVDLALSILNADGTETRVARGGWITGSISPDGSQVVYSSLAGPIYTVDTRGGEPSLLLARTRRSFPPSRPGGAESSFRTWLYNPTFSPDGTQIAYFDGMGDWGHSLRVMNADGSGVRILIDQVPEEVGHVWNLVWSPDGSHLAFSAQEGGIWIVDVDGSELTKAIPDGINAFWSPDGSRISYQTVFPPSGVLGTLETAAVDGTHVQRFGYGGSGPWNPVPLPQSR